jgi:hypothetical protein
LFITLLFTIAKFCNLTRCPSTDEWINKIPDTKEAEIRRIIYGLRPVLKPKKKKAKNSKTLSQQISQAW